MSQKFHSRISLGLILMMFLPVVSVLILLLVNGIWFMSVFIGCLLLFMLHLCFTTEYQFRGEHLFIKCGFLYKREINILSIKRIRKSRNPLSAPALSFDRLEILYNKQDMELVSPKDEALFIAELKKINAAIEVQDN